MRRMLVSAIFSAPWHDLARPGIAMAVPGSAVSSPPSPCRGAHGGSATTGRSRWTDLARRPAAARLRGLDRSPASSSRGRCRRGSLVGGASVLLMFIGIHNAWDTVTAARHASALRDGEGSARRRGPREGNPPPSACRLRRSKLAAPPDCAETSQRLRRSEYSPASPPLPPTQNRTRSVLPGVECPPPRCAHSLGPAAITPPPMEAPP